jgi:signal transduction histidine kinase
MLNGPETDPSTIEAMEAAIRQKVGYDFEMLRYRKSGEPFWMAIEARPIKDKAGNTTGYILIESDITARIDAELERQKLNEQLVNASRAAGIAEVATGVLHNVGNVLNSVNVSANVIEKQIRCSALEKLERVALLIEEHVEDFGSFVSKDSRGKKIPDYVLKLTNALKDEQSKVVNEFADLQKNVEHIKQIVSVQQDMAKTTGLLQTFRARDVIEDALVANKGTLTNHHVVIRKQLANDLPELVTDKRKVLQILINLISNAKDAIVDADPVDRKIEINSAMIGDSIQIEVTDSGTGIAEKDLSKIFQNGFTTKKTGHGFGLHSSANAATEIGGSLVAFSKGIGHGATFRLTFPFDQSAQNTTEDLVATCEGGV